MYTFKKFSADKIDDLLFLFLASDKTKVSREKFVKKYDTAYLQVAYVGYFAYDENDKPAAFYGVIPTPVYNKNKQQILVAQSADTITHPNHQKKGLFVKLAEMTYQLATELNIHFLYGIPNYLSYPGFVKKLGWEHHEFLQIFKLKIYTLPLANLAKRLPSFNGLYQKYCDLVLRVLTQKSSNRAFEKCNHELQIIATDEFVAYKSYTHKMFRKVNGVDVWISVDGYLKLGEIQGLNDNNVRGFLRKIKLIGFLIGSHKVVYQCNTIHENYAVLSKHIQAEEGLPIIFKNLSNNYEIVDFAMKFGDVDTF